MKLAMHSQQCLCTKSLKVIHTI